MAAEAERGWLQWSEHPEACTKSLPLLGLPGSLQTCLHLATRQCVCLPHDSRAVLCSKGLCREHVVCRVEPEFCVLALL